MTCPNGRFCEGFRMPAMTKVATGRGAGIRKPPGKEPAGEFCEGRGALYGDLGINDGSAPHGERVESKDRRCW
jgi:hypothetical protein